VSGKPAVGTAAWLVTKVSTAIGDRQGFPLGRLPVQHSKAGRPVLNKGQYRGQTCDLNLLAHWLTASLSYMDQHTHIGIMPVIKDQITALRRHNA
jgi:hypothetical protein